MKKVNIKGKVYNIRYSLRALFTFETITNRPFESGRLLDMYMLLFSMLLSGNDEFTMSFEEFIDECDSDESIFNSFMECMGEVAKRNSSLPACDKKKA